VIRAKSGDSESISSRWEESLVKGGSERYDHRVTAYMPITRDVRALLKADDPY
jgi:hypothetical protein